MVSVYECSGSKHHPARLVDGNNGSGGLCRAWSENGTVGAVIEDVDCKRQGNGTFAF